MKMLRKGISLMKMLRINVTSVKIPHIKTTRLLLTLSCVILLAVSGCHRADSGSTKAESEPLKMVAILPGMIEDQSWNKTNYEGILKCRETLGVDLEYVENVMESDFESVLTEYGRQGYGLVMAAGSQFDDAVSVVAPKFPGTTFCVVNGSFCEGKNVAPIFPKEYEASYLASIIAGNITQSGILGIIAGYPNSPMEHLLDVYERNATAIAVRRGIENPQTLRSYANSWSDVDLGKKIAEQMIDSGADTLFIYANEVGLGCIQAAKEKQVKVIGFSDNQNDLEPGTVAASVYFDFGTLYSWAVEQYMDGKLQGDRFHEIGIREGIFVPVYPEGTPKELKDAVDQGITDFLDEKVDLTQWFSD